MQDKVTNFTSITGATEKIAKLFLQANKLDLQAATNSFYQLAGDITKLDLPEPNHNHNIIVKSDADILPSTSTLLEWNCDACTFINPFSNAKCSVCNTDRPQKTNNIMKIILKDKQEHDLKILLSLHPFPINEVVCFGYLRNIFNIIPQVIYDIVFKFYYQKPQIERKEMVNLGVQNFNDIAKCNQLWYAVNAKWYKKWVKFTEYDKINDMQIIGGIDNMHKKYVLRPNWIDNSPLCQDLDNPHKLRKDITGDDNNLVIWLSQFEWDLLYKWYGCNYVFGRKVFMSYSSKLDICTHPIFINLVFCDKISGKMDIKTKTMRSVASNQTVRSLIQELEYELYDITPEIRQNDVNWNNTPYIRIWLKFGILKAIYPFDKKYKVTMDDLANEDHHRWVEMPDDYSRCTFNELLSDNGFKGGPYTYDKTFYNNEENLYFMVECKNVDKYKLDTDDDKNDDDNKDNNNNAIIYNKLWPREIPNILLTWDLLKTGMLVDVMDEQDKWYESLIRYKGIETSLVHPLQCGDDLLNLVYKSVEYIIIHFIGWNIKWDLKYYKNDFGIKIKARNSVTVGPHRPRRRH